MKKILVVEDDIMLNSGVCYNLEMDSYKVVPVYNLKSASEKLKSEKFNLIILDLNLPDGHGFDFYKKISLEYKVPVVFLTACDLEEDIMKGFDLGADDYIVKPFNINIFRKKIRAILNRLEKPLNENKYVSMNLTIDFDKLKASINNKAIVFTPTEYKILKIFTSNKDILLTRGVLLEKLYDIDSNFVDEHALTVHINRLRSKVDKENTKYIKTVYGMGYIWTGGRSEG